MKARASSRSGQVSPRAPRRSWGTVAPWKAWLFSVLGGPSSLAAQQQESATDPGFWVEQGDKVLVAVVTAVLVLLVQKPVKVLLDRVGRWLEDRLGGLGFRFRKRYLEALADRHRRLRLIGIKQPVAEVCAAALRAPCGQMQGAATQAMPEHR